MAPQIDILDERDPVALPLTGSIVLHAAILLMFFFGISWLKGSGDLLGDPNPSGSVAYAVSPTRTIPIPQPDAPPNPVSHDSQSLTPTAPAPKEAEKKEPEPKKDAFELPDKKKPQQPQPQQQQRYTPQAPPNQVYSRTPQAVSNPMYSQQGSGGQVGVGADTLFGNRFGAYAQLIRNRLAQNWNNNGLDPRSQVVPAVVRFHIQRNGTISNPQLVTSSGNPEIDRSAQRAVIDSQPMPPIPPQYPDNDIEATFSFTLK